MNLTYNAVLANAEICGIDIDEYKEMLGTLRTTILRNALHHKPVDTISIDMSLPFRIFLDILEDINSDIDKLMIFKIVIEYIILFRQSSNTEALAQYLSWYLEDEALAYNIAINTERLFMELISYIVKFEDNEESLVPFHWDDTLDKLILIKA